jgi:hypothetical protein
LEREEVEVIVVEEEAPIPPPVEEGDSKMIFVYAAVVMAILACLLCKTMVSCSRDQRQSREKRFLKLLNA